ncbi:methionine ABC transporter ATP-binding protein [Candidatus Tokpelaia sp.]|uniref:methionine ABC transporter ATP-binding protein n=1 Tax=Candidatus Tokpelaia sp. TaxID=2233777 RepID=UPI00123AE040|nr:methionine ABC transporter ATP-binding protein [Candidatus Tokpelaia sp.]KAA6405396.1 methionine ABC transporter ATP-binding protein [Candidatus Tokpelaia sp.]
MSTRPKAQPLLELKNLRRSFGGTKAVNGVSLTVYKGEILGIIGRSGAGKSTLIRCINGLEKPDSGSIFYKSRDSAGLTLEESRQMRRRIAMIFQQFNLLSSRTIIDNVALPLKLAGMSKIARRQKAAELLQTVGLGGKEQHYPAFLSGGQKQRVGIARALAAGPDILLSDEASSALDPETTQAILQLLREINRKMGVTIILITHEMEVIRAIADRLIVLDKGKIVEQGAVKDIFARPQAAATRALLQTIIPSLPPALAAQLRPQGHEAVIEFHLSGAAANTPFLQDLQRDTGAIARIIHGGMDTIQGERQGRFFLALNAGDKAKLAQALAWLAAKGDKSEVLGYV